MHKNLYGIILLIPILASAQITIDSHAAKNQQPSIQNTVNGLSQINIQTPSSLGVSRNTYNQFDVARQGVILNNARSATKTQLGGWVKANPWLNSTSARIILNEVNSSNPSLLNGYIEVAGNKAEVVVANPSGISCDGCGFINANHAVLSTGIPLFESGNLNGYLVERGTVTVQGSGLDATRTDYTDILSRSVAVNAGIWANHLNITAGSTSNIPKNEVKPTLGIDTTELGGMYAGKITLVATESGVGVRNAGHIAATSGDIHLTADGRLENSGQITSHGHLHIQTRDLDNTNGMIGGTDQTSLTVNGQITNTKGTLQSAKNLVIDATGIQGDGKILSEGDLNVKLINDYTHTGEFHCNENCIFQTVGKINNLSKFLSGNTLSIYGGSIHNAQGGEIQARTTDLIALDELNNRGLIDGLETHIKANTVDNLGTGRLYGDHLMIDANTINNNLENNLAAVIAARQKLDIATQMLTNHTHALIFSAGDMAIGGHLSSDKTVSGEALSLNNHSATIEALGNLDLSAKQIRNTNEHFRTQRAEMSQEFIGDYQLFGSVNRYKPNQIFLSHDEVYYLNTPEGAKDDYSAYSYKRYLYEDQIKESDPGKILASQMMHLTAENLLNDKSQIIAGGDLIGHIGTLNNTNVMGKRILKDTGNATHFYRIRKPGKDKQGMDKAAYNPAARVQTISLSPTVYQKNTKPNGSAYTLDPIVEVKAVLSNISDMNNVPAIIRTTAMNITLPDNTLFHTNTAQNLSNYLIETDPRFTNHHDWLGSDYMLKKLKVDGADTQKRLGDAFYEQKLIREQLTQLTGRELLSGYNNDEDEYRALMDNGIIYAQKWALRPGIALTGEQMAELSTDMVWLVEKQIMLPDGKTTKALVPKLYVRIKEGDLTNDGTLLSGKNVHLNMRHDLTNSGTIKAHQKIVLNAENINNLGGHIGGADSTLHAQKDLNNIGGTLQASKNLVLMGDAIELTSTTHKEQNAQGHRTNLDQIGEISVFDPGATLSITANHDLNLNAVQIVNAGEGGNTTIVAGHNLNFNTVNESNQNHITWNADNQRDDASSRDMGSTLQTKGDLKLLADNDLNAKGASVNSEKGALTVNAGKNIKLTAGESSESIDEFHKKMDGNSLLSKTITRTHDTRYQTQALGSTFGADSVLVKAGKDLNLIGSHIIATKDTTLAAANNINLDTAKNTRNESHLSTEKKSGIFKADGGVGFMVGMQKQSINTQEQSSMAVASTVGSQGNVNIQSGGAYQQIGSDIITVGDINIHAKAIDIKNAENTNTSTQENKFWQTGFNITLTNPILSALQTTQQMQEAVKKTPDLRMQALALSSAGLAVKNAADAYGEDPKKLGGVKLSLSMGGSKNQDNNQQISNTTVSSQLRSGHDIQLAALMGVGEVGGVAGKNSDIIVQGSTINAGHDATLKAENEIKLLAAKNSTTQESFSRSGGRSIGAGMGLSTSGTSFSIDMNTAQSKIKRDEKASTWANSSVNAGNKLILDSSDNTKLKGAVVKADQVVAHVGGNFDIESLQDTSKHTRKESMVESSASIPILKSGIDAGSVSRNKSKINIDSDFASVTQQSGIQAGHQGFQIDVKKNTDLIGGVISSTDQAANNKNTLSTGTLSTQDLKNYAKYNADSTTIGIGYSIGGVSNGQDKHGNIKSGATQVPGTKLASLKGASATPPITMNVSGHANSTTKSGISTTSTEKDDKITPSGLNRSTTGPDNSNALKPIFNEHKVRAGFEITGTLTKEAGIYLNNRAKESTSAQKEIDQERKKPPNQQDNAKITQLTQTLKNNQTWEMGGTGRSILTALTTAAGGNVNSSATQFVQSAAVNYLQSLGTKQVKYLVDSLDGRGKEGARAALHAVLACGGGAVQAKNCNTGATGAAASVILNNLMDGIDGKNAANLSSDEKQARENLISGVIAGITQKAGGDAAITNAAAQIETENNSIALLLMPPPLIPITSSHATPGQYIEISTLKKYVGLWRIGSKIASNAVHHVFNESVDADVDVDSSADEKRPNTITPKARQHILDGDGENAGGGHRAGTNKPEKSEFPSDWSDEKIIDEITDIAADPNSTRFSGHSGRTIISGTRDGVSIRVLVDATGEIVTAYPQKAPRNPRRSN